MRKVLLYGCGNDYQIRKNMIKQCEQEGRFEIIGVSGRNLPNGNTLDGWPLIPPEKLFEHQFDNILIMSTVYEEEIREELLARGVNPHVFDYHLKPQYWDASLNGISIFSNLCWGGIAAHTLGIECCSPTKNLWIGEDVFPKFLEQIEYYLSLEPVFKGWSDARGRFDKAKYPILALDDITLYCNHDTDPDEAIEKWQRRKKKVHYDNMMAVFITEHPEYEEAFYKVSTIAKKYCLVPWKSRNPYSIYIRKEEEKPWHESALASAFPDICLDLTAMCKGEGHIRFLRESLNG